MTAAQREDVKAKRRAAERAEERAWRSAAHKRDLEHWKDLKVEALMRGEDPRQVPNPMIYNYY